MQQLQNLPQLKLKTVIVSRVILLFVNGERYAFLLAVEFGFSQRSYTATEGDGPLNVCAVLIRGVLMTDVTLHESSSASPDSIPLTFTSGQSSSGNNTQCSESTIDDDKIYIFGELVGTFTLHLSSDSTSVIINSTLANATVTIFDNDSELSTVVIACCIMTRKYITICSC